LRRRAAKSVGCWPVADARVAGPSVRIGSIPLKKPSTRSSWLGHAHHRGVQSRCVPAAQADRNARRHQDRHLMSPPSIVRPCSADRSRWSSTSSLSVRPSVYPAEPAKLGSASGSSCQAPRASLPPLSGFTTAPPAMSSPPCIVNGYVEIPIERAAPLRPTSRGFLPWRLSDDGPGARGWIPMGPSSETLHNCRNRNR
jgi:hypothetical protein